MKHLYRMLVVLLTIFLIVLSTPLSYAQKINEAYITLYHDTAENSGSPLLNTLIDACKSGLTALSKSVATWGADQILKQMFPEMMESDLERMGKMMEEMNDQLAGITSMLSNASATLDCSQLTQIVNMVRTSMYSSKAGEAMKDFLLADKFPDVKNARLSSMTTSLGIRTDEYNMAQVDFDEYTDYVVKMFTTQYEVIMDGKTYQMDIMEILHHLMMYKYKWENQAYNEWIAAENDMLNYVTLLIFVDEASIHARRQFCDDLGIPYYSQFDTRLETLKGHAQRVQELQGRIVKKLDDRFRHYWYQGRFDIMFYAETGNTQIPQENPKAALNTTFGNPSPQGIYTNDHRLYVNTNFWKPFVTYKSRASLVSYSLLNQIYQDYNGQKSLWDIFFSEEEGAFKKPSISESNQNNAEWIIDTGEYPLKYINHEFKGDDLVCYYVKDPGMAGNTLRFKLSTATQKLCVYHAFSSDPQTTDKAIQIGIYEASNSDLHVSGDSVPLPDAPSPPKTGDSTPVCSYMALLVCSAIVLFVLNKHTKGSQHI